MDAPELKRGWYEEQRPTSACGDDEYYASDDNHRANDEFGLVSPEPVQCGVLPSMVFEESRTSKDPARCRVAFLQTSCTPAASRILAVRAG